MRDFSAWKTQLEPARMMTAGTTKKTAVRLGRQCRVTVVNFKRERRIIVHEGRSRLEW